MVVPIFDSKFLIPFINKTISYKYVTATFYGNQVKPCLAHKFPSRQIAPPPFHTLVRVHIPQNASPSPRTTPNKEEPSRRCGPLERGILSQARNPTSYPRRRIGPGCSEARQKRCIPVYHERCRQLRNRGVCVYFKYETY